MLAHLLAVKSDSAVVFILCVYFYGIIIKERLQIVCHNTDFE